MTTTPRSRKLRLAGTAGLLAAGAVTGGILASTLGASAATSSSTPSPSTQSQGGTQSQGSTPVRGDEKSVSDSISATLKTKALGAVPGGTVYRIETDAGDATYEAHMTKSDGTMVTVKFDQNLNVTGVENGMGNGDPHGGGPHGNHSQDGSQGGSSSGSAAPTA